MMPVPVASRSAVVALACLVASTVMASPRAGADALYTVRDLGMLPGGSYSKALGLNNQGQVVGSSTRPSNRGTSDHWDLVPVIFEPDGTIREVELPGVNIRATWRLDMNDSGELARAAGVGMVGINNLGQRVGSSKYIEPGEQEPRPYAPQQAILVDGSERTFLGTLGGQISYASGINDAGHIVGQAQDARGGHYAFLFRDGEMINLGDQIGRDIGSFATVINNRGQILGELGGGESFLLDGDELIRFGGPWMRAEDLNDEGDVVGQYTRAVKLGVTEQRAFLFRDGVRLDLTDLIPEDSGWLLETAAAINDLGQIAGTGTIDGQTRAYLLTPNGVDVPTPDPIPEPGPIAVLGLAAGWALLRRSRAGR